MKIVTNQQITDAAIELVIEKGYSDMTTKDIAQRARVNETTLFRKLGSKKEIVLKALEENCWIPYLNTNLFENASWDLEEDLTRFMLEYYRRVTPEMVKLSIGLRSPQIYEETRAHILKVPESFISSLKCYFEMMERKSKIKSSDPQTLAITIFSATLGFIFLQASFGNAFLALGQEEYIESSVKLFVKGIC